MESDFFCGDEDGKSNSPRQRKIDDTEGKEKSVEGIGLDPTVFKPPWNFGGLFGDWRYTIYRRRDDLKSCRGCTPDWTRENENDLHPL